ncbi:MAG TPA: bifunctional diguanylate cyclase/phosphodiesterase [Burkholderiaceae bacterium]|nr:bifunctional diguanylate cyclase/phosphodiesterase [Burkholderiaceae bacterium]
MDRHSPADLDSAAPPCTHGGSSQVQRLDHLEQLVHERSAELTWANERLVAALYERSAAEAQAEELRKRDRATGLANRHALEERLDSAVKTHLARGEPAAVICIGVGRLAEVREAHGHAAADAVAQQVGERLQVAVRGSDTVARVGDNEFALLLSNLRQSHDAATVARKLFAALDAPLPFGDHELRLAPALGVAVLPEDAATGDLLLARAAAAMQYAREHGTGLYQFFHPDIAHRSARRLRLEAELNTALERDQFRVLFQPRVRVRDKRVIGAEALLRWEHPERGLLAPEAFLDIAEETGLIVPIGARVLDLACRQAATWPRELSVAVNLAPREFRGTSVAGLVGRALEDTGLAASRLQIEVNESALMRMNETAAVETLAALTGAGVRVVLDNFGAGSASLSALRKVAIDGLKLNGEFLRGAAVGDRDGAIVAALASLGKRLRLRVIAAGIESEEQLAFARKAGIGEAQGFLLGRPMEPLAFRAELKSAPRRRARR